MFNILLKSVEFEGIKNNRINQFEKLGKYTNFKTRLQFMNAYVQGRLTYMLATYTNLNNDQLIKTSSAGWRWHLFIGLKFLWGLKI